VVVDVLVTLVREPLVQELQTKVMRVVLGPQMMMLAVAVVVAAVHQRLELLEVEKSVAMEEMGLHPLLLVHQ
jgi:hypothetical protein